MLKRYAELRKSVDIIITAESKDKPIKIKYINRIKETIKIVTVDTLNLVESEILNESIKILEMVEKASLFLEGRK